jgi:hypothetical protein
VIEQTFDPSALEGYEGKWVAIRDGAVVAAAETLELLRTNPEVRRDDAVYVVPEPSTYFY